MMGGVPIAAGRPPLDAGGALTSWTPDGAGTALVVLLAVGYLLAVRRVRLRGEPWPVRRTASWLLLGVGSLVVTTLGWVGAYGRTLFWVHVLQIILLLLVVPGLLALGRPALLVSTLRDDSREPGVGGRVLRLAASPLVGPALVPLALAAVVFTPVLPTTLTSSTANGVAEVALLAVGLLVTLPLAGAGAAASTAVATATFIGFLELLLDAIPGFALRMRSDLLARAWASSVHRSWGPSPLADQQLGGSILWGLAEVLDLPFLALLVVAWIKADEREAAATDAALDAEELRRPVPALDPLEPEAPLVQRPWWETDASVLGSGRARRLQRQRRPPAETEDR